MIYGLYLSSAGMISQQFRQDVIANNVANVETAGFKRDVAIFRARQQAAAEQPAGLRFAQPVLDGLGGGLLTQPTFTIFQQGAPEVTNNALDVTIIGEGFFAVRAPDGKVSYTRDGRFGLDRQGNVTTFDGLRQLLDSAGKPVQISPDLPVHISADGAVSQAGQVVAELGLSRFQRPQLLQKVGQNLYEAPPGAGPQTGTGTFKSGSVERSTVDPTTELVAMIQAQRAYEANASMIRLQDQTLGRVVNDLTRNV